MSNGEIPYGGTLTSKGNYPIAYQKQVKGGLHVFSNNEALAKLPVELMELGMQANVRQFTDSEGNVVPARSYTLNNLPSQRVFDIPSYKLTDYWKAAKLDPTSQGAPERQYSPDVNGGRPLFLPTDITSENYQAGYKTNAQNEIIWSGTYEPEIHSWVRERQGSGLWGIPIDIRGEDYTKGDYIDNIFIWVSKGSVPNRPDQVNNPSGWSGVPYVPGTSGDEANYATLYTDHLAANDLYMSSAEKDKYQNLVSDWTEPILISSDPNLVRYGTDPNNTDYLNATYWKPYFIPNLHVYMAVRKNTSSAWQVIMIDKEATTYIDFVYKEFDEGYTPTSSDKPTTTVGYGTGGWKDGPFVVTSGKALYQSYARKFNQSTFVDPSIGWSTPIRAEKEGQQVVWSAEENPVTFPSNLTLQQVLSNQGGDWSDWTDDPTTGTIWRRERINGTWLPATQVKGEKGTKGNTAGGFISYAYSASQAPAPTGKRAANGTILPSQTNWLDVPPNEAYYETYATVLINTAVVGSGDPDITNPDHWIISGGWRAPKSYDWQGEQGEKGDIPEHQWNGTELRFENPDGTFGSYVDLKGEKGEDGEVVTYSKGIVYASPDASLGQVGGISCYSRITFNFTAKETGTFHCPIIARLVSDAAAQYEIEIFRGGTKYDEIKVWTPDNYGDTSVNERTYTHTTDIYLPFVEGQEWTIDLHSHFPTQVGFTTVNSFMLIDQIQNY